MRIQSRVATVILNLGLIWMTALLKMERLKHACFMHISAHFMRPNPESSMHEISGDNIE